MFIVLVILGICLGFGVIVSCCLVVFYFKFVLVESWFGFGFSLFGLAGLDLLVSLADFIL